MISSQSVAPPNQLLDADAVQQTLHIGLEKHFSGDKVLVLIPDRTRTIPLPQIFRMLVDILQDSRQLDFMVALGTHPPLNEASLCQLLGITTDERLSDYKKNKIFNHIWDFPDTLTQIATLPQSQIQEIAGDSWHPSLGGDVPVRVNQRIFNYDHILILGPTLPHEVAGFSGGAKYLFPGISGAEMIDVTHWLGALSGVIGTIGFKDTPVRRMIHAATEYIHTPITLISLVVEEEGIAAVFIGDHISAWEEAVKISAERHIIWVDKPINRVLSCAPPMYNELWTGAKAMYKLSPVIAEGGEVIVYAPHLEVVSDVHGDYIYQIGYHVMEYFLNQWEKFKDIPLGVLAHSTHFRGPGRYENGIEYPFIEVTLASKIPYKDCSGLSLRYLNPADVDLTAWQNPESEGILFVPKAGEMLYRLRPDYKG